MSLSLFMIKIPKFTEQQMYDYETFFHLSMNENRLSKFLAHYESFKISKNILLANQSINKKLTHFLKEN